MLTANNFAFGLLTPALGYLMSCVGAYLGLLCASRGLVSSGASRPCWLGFAALAFGSTCIWVMHFIAMLGYAIPGETILYNVPVTLLSMVIAVVAVGIGLFIVGFGGGRPAIVLTAGIISGAGVASVHYVDMDGMRMAAAMHDSVPVRAASVLLAVAGMTALLWGLTRLRGGWQTAGAALLAATVVSGLHYVGMAGMQLLAGMHAMGMSGGGATATGFLLPLILGISIPATFLAVILALSPSPEEMSEEAQLMERIGHLRADELAAMPLPSGQGTGALARPLPSGRTGGALARPLPSGRAGGATALPSVFAAGTGSGSRGTGTGGRGPGPGQTASAGLARDSVFSRQTPVLTAGTGEVPSPALARRRPEPLDLAEPGSPAVEGTAGGAWHGAADAGIQCPNCTGMSAADFGRLLGSLKPLVEELRSVNANDKEIISACLGLTLTDRHERGVAGGRAAGRLASTGTGPRVARYLPLDWQ